jgi:predicted O-methyltransferase YrrM
MHERLGCALPCDAAAECRALWPDAIEALRRRGLRVGPASFGIWNDGDPEFVRAVWCLVRHLRPAKIVETGVARGLTSRFILEALARNGSGHLWSIDLPPALDTHLHAEIGAAVEAPLHARWTYLEGSSRRRLPRLLADLGEIDLFIHDSMHTEDNVRFELDRAWAALRPGGAVVVDDIDLNWGFHSFAAARADCRPLVCQAEPLAPDPRRVDGRGLFGIAWKPA